MLSSQSYKASGTFSNESVAQRCKSRGFCVQHRKGLAAWPGLQGPSEHPQPALVLQNRGLSPNQCTPVSHSLLLGPAGKPGAGWSLLLLPGCGPSCMGQRRGQPPVLMLVSPLRIRPKQGAAGHAECGARRGPLGSLLIQPALPDLPLLKSDLPALNSFKSPLHF